MQRAVIAAIVGVAIAGLSIEATAQNASAIAVMPIVPRGKIPKAVLTRTQAAVQKVLTQTLAQAVISPSQLRKANKGDIQVALKTCGNDIPCIAQLGRNAGASEVLLLLLAGTKAEYELKFVAISVASGGVRGHSAARLPRKGDPTSRLATPLSMLYATTKPETVASAEPTPTPAAKAVPGPAAMLALPPMPTSSSPATSPAVASAEEPTRGESPERGPASIDAASSASASPAPVGAATPAPTTLLTPAALAMRAPEGHAFEAPTVEAPPSDSPSPARFWRYSTIGLLLGGSASAAVGGYFGYSSQSIRGTIKNDGHMGQLTAIGRNNQANEAASHANVFYAIGGGLLGLATITFVVDLAGGH